MTESSGDIVDTVTLGKALGQLREAIAYYHSDIVAQEPRLKPLLRTAAIQAFEYSFELSIKTLKRTLIELLGKKEVDIMPYRDVLREAAKREWINDPNQWFEFRNQRNQTSHTYSDQKAEKLFAILPEFLESAEHLLSQLHAHDTHHRA